MAKSIEPVTAVMVGMFPYNFGSLCFHMTSCDLKVLGRLLEQAQVGMTLQLEHHAMKDSVTRHYRNSSVPALELAQQREWR